jgi:hypothetical protein
MGKIKEEIQFLKNICKRKYEKGGSSAVINYFEDALRLSENIKTLNVIYEYCENCNANMPSINHECLVCGQEIKTHPYFEIIHQGINENTGKEQIEIYAGKNGVIYLTHDKDNGGFVINVYGWDSFVNTMRVLENDMLPLVKKNSLNKENVLNNTMKKTINTKKEPVRITRMPDDFSIFTDAELEECKIIKKR